MPLSKSAFASQGATSGFVLLWGCAAIFTRLGLDNASPLTLLIFRFAIALGALLIIGIFAAGGCLKRAPAGRLF